MSQQQFYETVQRQEEWENDMKLKTFREQLHQELLRDSREYCAYCGQERYTFGCCGEVHYVTYKDMDDEWQKDMLECELEEYEEWSKK